MAKQLQFWESVAPSAAAVVLPDRRKSSTVRKVSTSAPAAGKPTAATKKQGKRTQEKPTQEKPTQEKPTQEKPTLGKLAERPADRTTQPIAEAISESGGGRAATLGRLRQQIRHVETGCEADGAVETISCGATVLDRMLPQRGLPRAAMSEWVASAAGQGAAWLSLTAAAEAVRTARPGKALVILDSARTFYPPAVFPLGLSASQLILLRPASHADLVWSADQALRSPAVSAVWGTIGEHLDDRDARRLQLAAETGDTTALFVRPAAVLRAPTFAAVRWHVRGLPSRGARRRLRVQLARCRGGVAGKTTTIAVDLQSGAIHPAEAGRDHRYQEHQQDAFVRESRPAPVSAAAMHLVSQLADPAMASRPRERGRQRDSA